MEIDSVQDVKVIIERFKNSMNIEKDVDLAQILGVLPSTISTWKKRNSLNHDLLIELCKKHKIDLNYLFFGTSPEVSTKSLRTPFVNRFSLHEYTLGNFENNLWDLPAYIFPFVKNKTSRAFQVISGNMWPLIEEDSVVICQKAELSEIQQEEVLALISRKKGFFINRVKTIEETKLLLTNDNPHFMKSDMYLEREYIDEAWWVTGILKTNIQGGNGFIYSQNEKSKETHQRLIKKERELVANSLKMTHLKNEIQNTLKAVDAQNSNGISVKLKALSGNNGAWEYFMKRFVDVHPNFIKELQRYHSDLTKNDIDFCSLISLGLSNKEIGTLLNISHQSVITKKYRLRKKMDLSRQEKSLEEYLKKFEKDFFELPYIL